jgi:hypothetical protein
MRARVAPVATLIAISRCLAKPRASSKLATFAHPISKNKNAAAITSQREVLALLTVRSIKEPIRSEWSRFVAENSWVRASLIEARSS